MGSTSPPLLRADHVLPSTYTAPVPASLSISSVTRAGQPMTRSRFVGIVFALARFIRGRTAARIPTETTRNNVIWSHSAAPKKDASSAAAAPPTNQMDTSAAVAASKAPKAATAPSQIQFIIKEPSFFDKNPFLLAV